MLGLAPVALGSLLAILVGVPGAFAESAARTSPGSGSDSIGTIPLGDELGLGTAAPLSRLPSLRDDLGSLPSRIWQKTGRIITPDRIAMISLAGQFVEEAGDRWDPDVRHEVGERPEQLGRVPNTILDGLGTKPFQLGAAGFLYGASHLFESPRLHAFSVDLTDVLVMEALVVGGLKYGFDTTRPNGERHGFPSGHTASAVAVASTIHQHFGLGWGSLAYATAGFVGVHRLDVRKHDLSDVLFGAALGLVLGHAGVSEPVAVTRRSDVRVVPVVDEDTGVTGLGLEWRF